MSNTLEEMKETPDFWIEAAKLAIEKGLEEDYFNKHLLQAYYCFKQAEALDEEFQE